MATLKYKTEGGSGGKLGHSNMSHWDETEAIKEATKVRRRNNEKKEIRRAIEDFSKDVNSNS